MIKEIGVELIKTQQRTSSNEQKNKYLLNIQKRIESEYFKFFQKVTWSLIKTNRGIEEQVTFGKIVKYSE